MSLRIGIDIGGTFTDLVAHDPERRQLYEHKVLTTPSDPAAAVLAGIGQMLERGGLPPWALAGADIVHGTTLVTNALIERKGQPIALLATKDMIDVLETGRENRYDPYDRMLERPPPLVPRWLRYPIEERMLADGTVRTPLDKGQVAEVLRALSRKGIRAVAVCFLHAYTNPRHELDVRAIVEELGLDLYVTLSSEVAPEIGEWERIVTTTANAYIQPVVDEYLRSLRNSLEDAGHRGRFFLMWSDGGLASADSTLRVPIRLLESGPAAGALAARHFSHRLGLSNVIAFDMGGTTAKICLIKDGEPVRAPSFEVGRVHRHKRGSGLPLRVPSIQMLEIGAGGGSIASADSLGLMNVGPQSAGADPGPACYGMGGVEPTVTDANLLLGYLSTERTLAGNLELDPDASGAAMTSLADEMGLSIEEAAIGVRRIVTANMAQAAQLHVTERTDDPRDFTLMAFGGAGPLHAYDVARRLGVRRVVIPPGAGVLSSLGFLTARAGMELTQSFITPLSQFDFALLRMPFGKLVERAKEMLATAGVPADTVTVRYILDMRYRGQGFEIQVALPRIDDLSTVTVGKAFAAAYHDRFGLSVEGMPEIRACRIRAEGPQPEPLHAAPRPSSAGRRQRPARRAWFDEIDGWADAAVYGLEDLEHGRQYAGPLLVDATHTTVVVGPGGCLQLEASGELRMDVPAQAASSRRADTIDAISLEIIIARLRGIADEADHALLRTAFSSAVREGKDYSLVIADPSGRCLALPTESMPLFVTSMPRTISLLAERYPPKSLSPGDVILTNDPWLCAGHKSDLALVAPVFSRDEMVAFVGTILHVPDIGGATGDFRAWDVYEEGLGLPPVKLYEGGRRNDAVWSILGANVRFAEAVLGDVDAMRASIAIVSRRLREWLHEDPTLDLSKVADEISTRASAAFLQRLQQVPNGSYYAETEQDGILHLGDDERRPIRLAVHLQVSPRGVVVDYSDSEDQRKRQPVNVPLPYTIADTIYSLQYMLAPALPNIGPQFTPVEIRAREGSILNAVPPVPVFARTRTGIHIATLINAALSQAVPDLVQAGSGHTMIVRIEGNPSQGQTYELSLMPKGGMGATGGRDGWNCTVFPTNCSMVSTEVAESRAPILISREMRCDSGGPGRERGGVGQTVRLHSLADHALTVSFRPNFVEHDPIGLNGGRPGARAHIEVNGRPLAENPVVLSPGEWFEVWTPGGGGVGDPRYRPAHKVAADVRAGLVSRKAARDVYGIDIDALLVGEDETGATTLGGDGGS